MLSTADLLGRVDRAEAACYFLSDDVAPHFSARLANWEKLRLLALAPATLSAWATGPSPVDRALLQVLYDFAAYSGYGPEWFPEDVRKNLAIMLNWFGSPEELKRKAIQRGRAAGLAMGLLDRVESLWGAARPEDGGLRAQLHQTVQAVEGDFHRTAEPLMRRMFLDQLFLQWPPVPVANPGELWAAYRGRLDAWKWDMWRRFTHVRNSLRTELALEGETSPKITGFAKRGRPPGSDAEKARDENIADQWAKRNRATIKSYKDLGEKVGMGWKEVKRVLDRRRKRRGAQGKSR